MSNKKLWLLAHFCALAALAPSATELHAQTLGVQREVDWKLWASLAISVAALLAAALLALRSVRAARMGQRRRTKDPFIIFPLPGDGPPLPEPALPHPVVPQPATPAPPPHAQNAMVEGHTIRFYRPPEGTLQLLPGRLEVVDGADRGHEIRFVRTRDSSPEITFGRTEGPPHRHIQLRAGTVSREHARMRLEGGHWRIANLSRTNPVVVNGEELSAANGGRVLREGDRIEMGEVVFQFRER